MLSLLIHEHGMFSHLFIYSFIYFINLFIYFWLCWVFVAVHRLSLVVPSRSYSSLRCTGFSLRWLFLLWSTGSRSAGFQQLWHVGSVAVACGL